MSKRPTCSAVDGYRLSGVDEFELFDRQKIDTFDDEFGQDQLIGLLWPLGIYEDLERIPNTALELETAIPRIWS